MPQQSLQQTPSESIQAIPSEQLHPPDDHRGFRGLYHAVNVADYGSTVSDPYCQIYDLRSYHRSKHGIQQIADLSLDEVEQLISLLQAARHSMIDLSEPQGGA